ncbi:MAG: polyphosphate kinase 2 family protein [Actinobacteria bacterium]|nr:polyphosphate kinase 2 family protein [Actinomycetota bacterium]MCB9390087.1 polyphosphate kinase 2 family protein [Acidimicrobiia bacterium]
MNTQMYRVTPGGPVALSDWDPDEHSLFPDGKDSAKDFFDGQNKALEQLQELLYAEGKRRLLIVLQGLDAGGKDGTIRSVFDHVNPQGVKVASFKQPSTAEAAHDYLWRVHQRVPGDGEITIFNRSHYEDVLVVRVHDLVPKERWERRYEQINNFEQMLTEEGTTILKFFLHISREEQRQRLQERIDNPSKRWKFSHADLKERGFWESYQEAYTAMLNRTSTEWAPWYVIPANRNWYRNVLISQVVVRTLEGFNMSFPEPEEGIEGMIIPA